MRTPLYVTLFGNLDLETAKALRDDLAGIDGPAVVDLSRVTYITSVALSEFQRLAVRVGRGTVTLIVPQPPIRRVLQVVGFDQLFRIESRVDAR